MDLGSSGKSISDDFQINQLIFEDNLRNADLFHSLNRIRGQV